MSYRFIILSISLTLLLSTTLSAAEFVEKISFQVPGLTEIEQMRFNDIDFDGIPEALVLTDSQLVLYSIGRDSILLSTSIETSELTIDSDLLFKDVNRDSIPDVLCGIYQDFLSFGLMRISFINGVDIVSGVWTVNMKEDTTAAFPSYLGIGLFNAFDINDDGYGEFIASWDSSRVVFSIGYNGNIAGITEYFYSYPDSMVSRDNRLYYFPVLMPNAEGQFLIASERKGWIYELGPDECSEWSILRSLPGGLLDSQSAEEKYSGSYNYEWEQPLIAADLLESDSGIELLSVRRIVQGTYDTSTTRTTYQLFSFSPPDSLRILWEMESDKIYPNIQYDPQYPHSYFSFGDQVITRFSGEDGHVIAEYPYNALGLSGYWDYFDDPYKKDYFVINGNAVTIYSFDIATEVDDDGEQHPTIFTFGQPYPNPFNATQTIPITVERPGAMLSVTVYNLLGQEVGQIYQGTPNSQSIEIQWNAEAMASGVYFIKAISGQTTRVVRTVLLK